MTVTDGPQQPSSGSSAATGGPAEGDHLRRPAPSVHRHHNTLMAGGRPQPLPAVGRAPQPQTHPRSKSNGSLFFAPMPHYAAAPLAAADLGDSDDDDLAEYAQVKEVYEGGGAGGLDMAGQPLPLPGMYTFPHDGHHGGGGGGGTTPNKHQQQMMQQQQQQQSAKLATRHRRDVNKSEWELQRGNINVVASLSFWYSSNLLVFVRI